MNLQTIADALEFAPTIGVANLTMYPLLHGDETMPGYATLDEALAAYQAHCAVCRLRHAELLEAAHILPDGHPLGHPVVPNGVALCKLHHATFDANILGIRPDYGIEIRLDVLEEKDGPMLKHGLQEFHHGRLWTPHRPILKPNPEVPRGTICAVQERGLNGRGEPVSARAMRP
jgi:putative restriction endonuclease